MRPQRTLASERVLSADHNAFGFLRLVFAGFVIVSHSWTLGGYGPEPLHEASGGITLGYLGVCAFFALSGALVGASAERTPPGTFLWHRARRVLPAYWVCLVLSAFAFPALIAHLKGLPVARALATPEATSAASYVVNNFPLRVEQYSVGYALAQLPFSKAINGSLWSLPHEFVCYLAILLLARAWLRSGRRAAVALGMLATLLVVCLAARTSAADETLALPPFGTLHLDHLTLLGTIFLIGALLAWYRERVPFGPPWVLVAAILFGASLPLGLFAPWGLFLLPYVVLGLGRYLPSVLRPIGRRVDVSYGLYLYGFPVGQALVASGKLPASGPALAFWTFVLTWPIALGSWFAVERRFLRSARSPDASGESPAAAGADGAGGIVRP